MVDHELKTWPEPFEATWTARKLYEVRRDDRGYEEGDVLFLREYDPDTETYTGRSIQATVDYVTRSDPPSPLPEGVVVLGLILTGRLKIERDDDGGH